MEDLIHAKNYTEVYTHFSEKEILLYCYRSNNWKFYSGYIDYCLEHIEDSVGNMFYGDPDKCKMFRIHTRTLVCNTGAIHDNDNPRAYRFREIMSHLVDCDPFDNIKLVFQYRGERAVIANGINLDTYNIFLHKCIVSAKHSHAMMSLMFDKYIIMLDHLLYFYEYSSLNTNRVFNTVLKHNSSEYTRVNNSKKLKLAFMYSGELFDMFHTSVDITSKLFIHPNESIGQLLNISGLTPNEFIRRLQKLIIQANWPTNVDYSMYLGIILKFAAHFDTVQDWNVAIRNNLDFIRKVNNMSIICCEKTSTKVDHIAHVLSTHLILDLSNFVLEYI
jgi:hypothetical protein